LQPLDSVLRKDSADAKLWHIEKIQSYGLVYPLPYFRFGAHESIASKKVLEAGDIDDWNTSIPGQIVGKA
jgi:hypothetical protein